jgi:hypothetical protein
MATSFHCQSSTSRKSGGQAQVTQFGLLAPGPSPGQPEKQLTTGTPSSTASRAVFRHVSCEARANSASGWSGLPWQLSALIVSPRCSTARSSFEALPSSSSGSQCAFPG